MSHWHCWTPLLRLQLSSSTNLKDVFNDFASTDKFLFDWTGRVPVGSCTARVCATFKDLSCDFLLLLGNDFCIVWLVGCMPEFATSRSAAAAAAVLGDALGDRDGGGHAVDCVGVLDGAQSSVA